MDDYIPKWSANGTEKPSIPAGRRNSLALRVRRRESFTEFYLVQRSLAHSVAWILTHRAREVLRIGSSTEFIRQRAKSMKVHPGLSRTPTSAFKAKTTLDPSAIRGHARPREPTATLRESMRWTSTSS